MAAAAPAVPVAVKVTGLPFTPVDVAVRVLIPAALPSVQLPTAAIPLASVVWPGPVMVPFPAATANVTATPATGLPLASLTMTAGGIGTALPAATVWLFPACSAIWVAAPAERAIGPDVTVLSVPDANVTV